MGAELIPIITAVASSTVLVEIVRAIQTWLTSRRPSITLKIYVDGHTAEATLPADATEALNSVIDHLTGNR
jgi:Effector Associated Constant Component 1